MANTECDAFPVGSRKWQICRGEAGISPRKTDAYRLAWGLPPLLSETNDVVSVTETAAPEFVFHGKSVSSSVSKKLYGPGSELLKIYEAAGVPSCDACLELAQQMNDWGMSECRNRLDEIVADILPRARGWVAENRPWIHKLLPNVVEDAAIRYKVRQDLLLAIERAEASQQSAKQSTTQVAVAKKKSAASVKRSNTMQWAYGITTVPERRHTSLPAALLSLKDAGFDAPRLFVDGAQNISEYSSLGLEVTTRWPRVRIIGSWVLALTELYYREPDCDMFAIFQDDVVACKNMRAFLERTARPADGYLNLCTYPLNASIAKKKGTHGWFSTQQWGLGAQGLVFTRDQVIKLLSSDHMIHKVSSSNPKPKRRWKFVDGGIVEAMTKAGFREYCHYPGLIWHDHKVESSLQNERQPVIKAFVGRDFDALSLL